MGVAARAERRPIGMFAAMASAQDADKVYQLGEQQLQWSKDVWNQQKPTILASANAADGVGEAASEVAAADDE